MPTSLGHTAQGANADHWNTGDVAVSGPWTALRSGWVRSISVWKDGGTSDETICPVVYEDSGGTPGALVAYGGNLTVTAAGAAALRTTTTVTSNLAVKQGSSYWIGYVTVTSGSGGNTADDYSDLAAQGATKDKKYKTGGGYGNPPPDPFPGFAFYVNAG